MKIYISNKNISSSEEKNLVVLLTTNQSPHLEASFHYIKKNIHKYRKVYILEVTSDVPYRNEYSWRTHITLRQNIVRKIRNGIAKDFYIWNQCKKLKFLKKEISISQDILLDKSEIFSILKTYSMTEFKSAAFVPSVYDDKILTSIRNASSFLKYFVTSYKINQNDDFLLFNGRHPLEYSSRITLSKLGFKKIIYHECNNFAYKIFFTNFQIHQLDAYHSHIVNYYLNNKNLVSRWHNEKRLLLKKEYKKKYVIFFTSSFDEFSFAYDKPINQALVIHNLINNSVSIPLKIRVHPNTANKSKQDQNFWNFLKMKFPKIIINYDEDICSYELIKQSFFTISIGSSIAPESIILGTNHLLCGTQHMYSKLPGFYNSNESNLIKMTNRLFRNREKLKVITKNMQELCAASQLFNKDIGEEIPLSLFGKYPFRLKSKNFIDRILQNFKK